MALDAAISKCTVSFGVPTDFLGGDVITTLRIVPTHSVSWGATGSPVLKFTSEVRTSAQAPGSFAIPHVDQDGFVDRSGGAFKNWAYTAFLQYRHVASGEVLEVTKNFAPLVGQTSLDLDVVPDGPVSVPVSAPAAAVLGFGGRTGFINLQESDLPGRLAPESLNATYALIGAPAGNAVAKFVPNTAYGAGVQTISPSGDIVSAKVPFTAGATYNAADWNASAQDGRIITLEGQAPKVNDGTEYLWSWADSQDRVALGIKPDGSVEMGGKTPTSAMVKTTAVALTHAAGGGYVDARTAVQTRIPLKLGAAATLKKIHFRNYEDRSGLAHTGALSFTGVAWGESARTASGQLNGNFMTAPTSLSGAFTTAADGSDYVLSGLSVTIEPGKDYLLSFGYTCAAQNNHLGVGGSWTNTTPANFAATTDTLTIGKFAPLDVWLEIETTAPIVAWCGDSLSCGVSAELPGYQSVPMVHARANGYIPLMYTNSGSAMTSWVNASAVKYTKWGGLTKPEALVMSLSKNDFLTTTDMAVMRTRFDTLYPILTAATTKNMYLTTCMPNASEADATGTAERAWNGIILNEQLGNSVNVFDIRKAVTAAAGGLDPAYDSGDGVHLNKRGYAAVAAAIPHNIYPRG